jgi:hypothetical protein
MRRRQAAPQNAHRTVLYAGDACGEALNVNEIKRQYLDPSMLFDPAIEHHLLPLSHSIIETPAFLWRHRIDMRLLLFSVEDTSQTFRSFQSIETI